MGEMELAMTVLGNAATGLGYLSAVATAVVVFVKPVRDKVLSAKEITNGLKCILRSDMLRVYYKGHEANEIRQYDRENLEKEYKAYKALGGNSFIDGIYKEMISWEVSS